MSKDSGKVSSTVAERIVADLVLIAVGVLFCLGLVFGVIQIALGVALCICGVGVAVIAIVNKRSLFSGEGLESGALIALGVLCIEKELADIFSKMIPIILISIGLLFLLDAFVARFARKDIGKTRFIVQLVVGIVYLVLGVCCLVFVETFWTARGPIFGGALIVFGVYRLIELIVSKK